MKPRNLSPDDLSPGGSPDDFPGWLGTCGGGTMKLSAAMESIIPYNQMNALRCSVQNHLNQNMIFVTL